jgi:peptide/nickel transport system ATP-binding protein
LKDKAQSETLLSVDNLSIGFSQYIGGLKRRTIQVIVDLNASIGHGEVVAVVGASGSGKSLLAHSILGILPGNAIMSGRMAYGGEELTAKRQAALRGKEIAFIPQSVNFLDPLLRVGKQARIGFDRKTAAARQRELFLRFGLKEKDGDLFPFELSGGMLRRTLFATCVREGVKLIIADEPTPGIHPEALNEVLTQLRQLADSGAGVMLITHDIMSALKIADRVVVIKDGRTVEVAEASAFEGQGEKLAAEYTRNLWRALPENDFDLMFAGDGGNGHVA